MLKKRVISAAVIFILAAEIVLGSLTSYGAQFPLPSDTVSTTVTSQNPVYNPLNDPIRKALDESAAKKALPTPTISPSVTQSPNKATNPVPASVLEQNKNIQLARVEKFIEPIQSDEKIDKNEVIVKYKDISQKENTKKKLSAKKTKLTFKSKHWSQKLKLETIEVSDGNELKNVIDELKKDSNIEYAQPNYKLDIMEYPSDDRFDEQWGLQNSGQVVSGQPGTTEVDINAKDAWDITKGSDTVRVAVIDTGIDINHPDLAASIYRNPNEQSNDYDDDNNELVDDLNGWNFIDDTNKIFASEAEDTHGTHIAGIIAAGINNGGIVGVAPNIEIVPLKFISGSSGYTSDAISAIEYCEKMGISIANVSWGSSEYNVALKDAMEKSNIIFVCAAGNSARNIDNTPTYPAAYNLPNIISVAANDNRGQLASFSNYGTKVDLSAPGVNILSTIPGNKYGYLSGTSMAAPFVTGTVALLKSTDNTLSVAEIKDRILNNVTKSANLSGKVSSSGRLNAYTALINESTQESIIPVATQTPNQENSINKSKEPESIYNNSIEGSGKTEKPLLEANNLFVDALINKGFANTASSENGIENLSINKLKGNFISVSWTTGVESNSVLSYGINGSLDKNISDNELTTKHQLILRSDDMSSFDSYKVRSTTPDGIVFESGIKDTSTMTDLGGTPVLTNVSVSESVYRTDAQDITTLSYLSDNNANHSFAAAQTIPEGTVFGAIEQNGQHDYYGVYLTAGNSYTISLKGMAQGEDYDVILSDDTQYILKYAVNKSNYDERIYFTATYSGFYYIDIQPYTFSSGSLNHNYQLLFYSSSNKPDSFEPNDNKDTAKVIAENTIYTPTINISTDEDWYLINVTRAGKLSVTMKSIPTDCDYDIQVYRDGLCIGGSYSNGNSDEKFDYIINTPGNYYIRIYSYSGSSSTDTYELKAGVYSPDQYEINDNLYSVNFFNKPVMALNSIISGTLDNVDDADFYKFILGDNTNVGMRLQNIPSGNDYDMVIYNENSGAFNEVARSVAGGNADETVISQLPAGNYFIKVYSYYGSSDSQEYNLSLFDENVGQVSMAFDKSSALVGEIITATLKVEGANNIAGFQANIKYDPAVIQPIDISNIPYGASTYPANGSLIINTGYSPLTSAANQTDNGILNFGSCYLNLKSYKNSGIGEANGSLAVIRFKVLKNNRVSLRFENTSSMPKATSGILLYDWNGNTINNNVVQPSAINASLPVNPMMVYCESVAESSSSMTFAANTAYNISGYISPECGTKDGFIVSISGMDIKTTTDTLGYFKLSFKPTATFSGNIVITKNGYLKREIDNVTVSTNMIISTRNTPIIVWAGDFSANGQQDDTINIADIIDLAKRYNTTSIDRDYSDIYDVNKDGAINMADVIVLAKHFNTVAGSYPQDVQPLSIPRELIDSVNQITPEFKYWIIIKDQLNLNKYYLIKSSNELFMGGTLEKPQFSKPANNFYSGYLCASTSMCISNATCTGWGSNEYIVQENSWTAYSPQGSAIWSNYDIRYENPYAGFVVYPASEEPKLAPLPCNPPIPLPAFDTTVPSSLINAALNIYPDYKYAIILKSRTGEIYELYKSNKELFLCSWDGVTDPSIAKYADWQFSDYNCEMAELYCTNRTDWQFREVAKNNWYVGIGPASIVWCNYDIKFGNPVINDHGISNISEMLSNINSSDLVNVKDFIVNSLQFAELDNNLFFTNDSTITTYYKGSPILMKLSMKKYLNTYFARPMDIYNAIDYYLKGKSLIDQDKVALYKGTEQIFVSKSEVPNYLNQGWSEKPTSTTTLGKQKLQITQYTIQFCDSDRVWRLYSDLSTAINVYLPHWSSDPNALNNFPDDYKMKLAILNILDYNRKTEFSFEELKALYILDNEGFRDYIRSKSMAYLDVLFYKIFGYQPKHFRHDGTWKEIPLGESIDYRFVDGDVASESHLAFFGTFPTPLDLEVLLKVAVEVVIVWLTGVVFEEIAIMYLGRAIFGEALAIQMYRSGALRASLNYAKVFSEASSLAEFEYTDELVNAFNKVDDAINYEVEIINAEGKVITKTVAEAIKIIGEFNYNALKAVGLTEEQILNICNNSSAVIYIDDIVRLGGQNNVSLGTFEGISVVKPAGETPVFGMTNAQGFDAFKNQAINLNTKLLDAPLYADLNNVIPELEIADNILFFTRQDIVTNNYLTNQELNYVLSHPDILRKTKFVTGFFPPFD